VVKKANSASKWTRRIAQPTDWNLGDHPHQQHLTRPASWYKLPEKMQIYGQPAILDNPRRPESPPEDMDIGNQHSSAPITAGWKHNCERREGNSPHLS